ncbi:sorting nexin-33-like [Dendronephthya gigantea]|uniref:sorting nexin-33-like n=1 Tax=Dendronephthya gigantea TaxID=151771 RepID=UPI00106B152E|nr:sorting nexin-33-like [Dendronephthya gigantea]
MPKMASKVKAIYSFEGVSENNELTISEGEILTVTNPNIGDGWWEGVNSHGVKGLFPTAYVEPITISNAPSAPPAAALTRQPSQYSSGNDNEADDWEDEWDDDYDQQSINSGGQPNANGEVRRRVSSVGRSATIKKSFNRFSIFVKSGGESFLLGATNSENKTILANDVSLIIETSEGVEWDELRDPFTCVVTQPEKKSKFKGMKHFIAYNVTPSSTGVSVSRRFKHFDWLYCRLLEKFTCLSIPPIPDKQITGKYAEEFIQKRREQLERWLNRLSRHPLVSKSEVFQHFLCCKETEKEWKAGKRKAECDKLCGAAFFLTVESPTTAISIDEADMKIEEFSQFTKTMEQCVHRFNERCQSYGVKYDGVFKNSHKKFGSSFTHLSLAFEQHQSKYSQPLTQAIAHTGRTYDEIGEAFSEQPRVDLLRLMEGLQEYAGILTTFPEIINIHKSTVEKVKDVERKKDDEKVEDDLVEQVTNRANVITNVTLSEINLFHKQRVVDYKQMMQSFLREQISFYQGIVDKLQDSLQMYDNV